MTSKPIQSPALLDQDLEAQESARCAWRPRP